MAVMLSARRHPAGISTGWKRLGCIKRVVESEDLGTDLYYEPIVLKTTASFRQEDLLDFGVRHLYLAPLKKQMAILGTITKFLPVFLSVKGPFAHQWDIENRFILLKMSFFNGLDHLDIKNGSFSVTRNVVYLKGNFDNFSPDSNDNAVFHDSHLPKYLQITEGSFRVVQFIRRRGSSRLFYEGPDIPITNSGEHTMTQESAIKRILAYLISGVKHVDISGGTFSLQTTKTLASRGPFYVPQESTVHTKQKFSREPKNVHIHGASFAESTILIDSSGNFDKDHYGEFTNIVGLVNDTKIGFKGIPENYLPGLSLFPGCRKMEIVGGDFNVTLTDLVFLDDEPFTDNSLPQSRFPSDFNNGATPVTQTTINMNNIVNQQSTIILSGDHYSGNIEKSTVGGKGNSNQLTNNRQEDNHDDDQYYTRERGGGNDQGSPRAPEEGYGEPKGGNNQGYVDEPDGQGSPGEHGDGIDQGYGVPEGGNNRAYIGEDVDGGVRDHAGEPQDDNDQDHAGEPWDDNDQGSPGEHKEGADQGYGVSGGGNNRGYVGVEDVDGGVRDHAGEPQDDNDQDHAGEPDGNDQGSPGEHKEGIDQGYDGEEGNFDHISNDYLSD